MITILRMRPGDAAALTALMHRAVHDGASADYSPRQLHAWSPAPMEPSAFLARLADGRAVWVAFGADAHACGFVELTPRGHIDLFYCHPPGTGTGGALYAALKHEARARGLPRLTVDASEGARRFFQRAGFACQGVRQVSRRGVELRTYPMVKSLAPDAAT
ncbi:GNAT family N-acetyltransferase [Roseovarius sp. S1116L3]|uniref:GNAT family N-acetyltransferase n=1 Tax=Roseovarius roseus TaxID=3342636 RepID=UPI00372B68E1